MGMKDRMYLGDGVYAEYDGYQVWVFIHNGYMELERIALDPTTMEQLVKYAKDHGVLSDD